MLFDFGYFSSFGLSLSEIPTTIADHVRSALIWAPGVCTVTIAYILFSLMFRGFRIEFSGHDSSPQSSPATYFATTKHWFFRLIVVVAFIITIVDPLTGGQLSQVGIVASGIVVAYIAFSSAAKISERNPMITVKLNLLCWIVVVAYAAYGLGATAATNDRVASKKTRITVEAHGDLELRVLRYLDRGALAITRDGMLLLVPWSETKRVTSNLPPVIRTNWACRALQLMCEPQVDRTSVPAAQPRQ